jgi:heptosyltransferase-2
MRIGDAVVITPLLRSLKARFPKTEITLLVAPLVEELMRRAPGIDRLVPFARQPGEGARQAASRAAAEAGSADMAFVLDFTPFSAWIALRAGARVRIGYDRQGRGILLTHTCPWPEEWYRAMADYPPGTQPRHQAERWLALGALVGASIQDATPRLEPDRSRGWDDLVPGAGLTDDSSVIMIHPGSDSAFRWRADRWASVTDTLVERFGLKVIISGGPDDGPVIAAVRSHLKCKAPDLMHAGLARALDCVGRSLLVLTVDTSLAHLASAVDTPAVVLSGPSDARIWRPYGDRHVVINDPENRCGGCKQPRCLLETHLCMDGISVAQVLHAAEDVLARERPSLGGENGAA